MVGKQEDLYQQANSTDATSLPMLDYLKKRTGKTGVQMLHEGLEKTELKLLELLVKKPRREKTLRLAFVGTILVEKEFNLFVNYLRLMRDQNIQMTLEFWSAHSYAKADWFENDWMIQHGHIPRHLLTKEISNCDFGVICMPLDSDSARYSYYSFPTKFITYISSGITPIILGSRQSAVMQMAESYDIGIRLISENKDEHLGILKEGFSDPENGMQLRNIRNCALQHFDADKMRATLWSCFSGDQ
jgi:hypothetical protein